MARSAPPWQQHWEKYGTDKVLWNIRKPKEEHGPFKMLDIRMSNGWVRSLKITTSHRYIILRLSYLLTENGIQKDMECESQRSAEYSGTCHQYQMDKSIFPSTIAVFGSTTPREGTPQHTAAEPSTVYGMSKLGWIMVPILSFPVWSGCKILTISRNYWLAVPSRRGTTDYAVEIFTKPSSPASIHVI